MAAASGLAIPVGHDLPKGGVLGSSSSLERHDYLLDREADGSVGILGGSHGSGEALSLRPLHRLRRSPSPASQGRIRAQAAAAVDTPLQSKRSGRGRPRRHTLPRLRGRGTTRSVVEGAPL